MYINTYHQGENLYNRIKCLLSILLRTRIQYMKVVADTIIRVPVGYKLSDSQTHSHGLSLVVRALPDYMFLN